MEDAEAELKMLNNSEGIKTILSKVSFQLNESEEPIVQELKALQNQVSSISVFHPELEEILKRMQSAQIELQDIADEVERINGHVNYDPKQIERINERISTGYKLLKKHSVQTTNELLAIRSDLERKLQAVLNIDDAIAKKQADVEILIKRSK